MNAILFIYEYYDNVEKEVSRFKVGNRPECIWNLDETNLYIDPIQTKVVAPKGSKACRTTSTSGREATTVMATISADGSVRPPLIIFKGKNFMENWGTANALDVEIAKSDSGWMNSEIFVAWFMRFVQNITQRPLLLIYDGHSTHINYEIINIANKEQISIIKLPAHTTDKLQPLDVVYFRKLKSLWDRHILK